MKDREILKQLYAPFPLSAHSIRVGRNTTNRTYWFIYLERDAIRRRLDKLFPMEWEFDLREIKERKDHYSVIATMEICGRSRSFNGAWKKGEKRSDYEEKGAGTDAFRRVAGLWGIGDYLVECPRIYTDRVPENKNDAGYYDKLNELEIQAKRIFADWYKKNCEEPAPKSDNNSVERKPPVKTNNGNNQFDEYFPRDDKKQVVKPEGKLDETKLEKAIAGIFPAFKINDFKHDIQCDDLSAQYNNDYVRASIGIVNWCYHNSYTFAATHYRYVAKDNKKWLEFSVQKKDGSFFVPITVYVRSSTFKDMIGYEQYEVYDFARFDDDANINTWMEMPEVAMIDYEQPDGFDFKYLKLTEFNKEWELQF